jgi:hypothetical protein
MKAKSQAEGIIILGVPRSGTTLLRRLLNAQPQIACPGETNLLAACARFLASDKGAEGLDVGVVTGLGYAGFEPDEVLDKLREWAFGFFRAHAKRSGKRRWAEKSAFDSFHLEAIEQLVGNHAQFVCLFRHGLDTVCSLHDFCEKTQGYLDGLHPYVQRYPRPLEAFARAWVDLTGALRDFAERHPKNSISLNYEHLVANPEGQLQRVLDFLGEPFSPETLKEALQPTSSSGLGDWKSYSKLTIDQAGVGRFWQLPPGIRQELAEIVNPTLRKCGYEPVPADLDGSAEAARRRYQLGLMVQAMKAASKGG